MHDAEIISLGISDDKKNITILTEFQGVKEFILLKGVVAFRVEDFSIQNVIERILIIPNEVCDDEFLNYWINWATSLSDAGSWLSPEVKEDWKMKIKAGDRNMVVFIPSAGAQIAAVSVGVEVGVKPAGINN
ncbi:hypothetical protein [Paracidovorax oryzae]|uniref:hypothetical protein n=1 Tax=Paracidovorax oryzae TaxID=862720 RepID=UPI0012EB0C60|nr:hypothetical protein [Paracidovorax oryzae]